MTFVRMILFVALLLSAGKAEAVQMVFGIPSADSGGVTQVSCLTTTTAIDVADSGRLTFAIQNIDATNFVWVCFAATCTSTTGLKLEDATADGVNGIGASFAYEWTGPMSCIADTATSIITFFEGS